MKKLGLVSLAAAVALSTSAMADVKYSGKLFVAQSSVSEEVKGNDGSSKDNFEIDLDLTVMKKISDNFSATVMVQADGDQAENADAFKQNANVQKAYFTYNTGALSVSTGLLGISTPNTDGEAGAGLFATYGLGNVTLAGAVFTSNDLSPDIEFDTNNDGVNDLDTDDVVPNEHVAAIAALGKLGAADFQAWHIAISNIAKMNTLVLGGKVGPVALEARYATTSYESDVEALFPEDGSTMKISASTTLGNGVALRAAYLANDEDGATLTTDGSSANTIELDNLSAQNAADTTVTYVGATFPVSAAAVSLDYAAADVADNDITELVVGVSKSLAKGLSGAATYSMMSNDDADTDTNELEYSLTYKF